MEKKLNMVFARLLVLSATILLHGFMTMPKVNRYEMVQITDVNVAIIDHQNNEIYYKYFTPNEGPTNWEKLELPE